jgi:hypothetical protein
MTTPNWGSINFTSLINIYASLQKQVVSMIKQTAKNTSSATPGKFLLIQFQLSQTTQIGDSISNMMSSISSMVNNSIRNFKG